jgi:hypothetical protein
VNVEWLDAYGGKPVGDFGSGYGLYEYDGAAWIQLSAVDADNLGNTMKGINLY